MLRVLEFIDRANRTLGKAAAWSALVMMLCQAFSVVARYVFSYGIISVQEAVVYGHSLLFLLGAAYILQLNQHVRVDIFYAALSKRGQRVIDLIALLFFILPVAGVILWVSLPYVERSWSTLESSRQAGGIPAVFLLKSAILIFAMSVGLQAIATILRLFFRLPDAHWQPGQTKQS